MKPIKRAAIAVAATTLAAFAASPALASRVEQPEGTGGITLVPFHDFNGNGTFDPQEGERMVVRSGVISGDRTQFPTAGPKVHVYHRLDGGDPTAGWIADPPVGEGDREWFAYWVDPGTADYGIFMPEGCSITSLPDGFESVETRAIYITMPIVAVGEVTIEEGDDPTFDFPVACDPISVTGTAFMDTNGNGVRDEGEAPVPGVEVTVDGFLGDPWYLPVDDGTWSSDIPDPYYTGAPVTLGASSGEDGGFLVDRLEAGSWEVSASVSDCTLAFDPQEVDLDWGQSLSLDVPVTSCEGDDVVQDDDDPLVEDPLTDPPVDDPVDDPEADEDEDPVFVQSPPPSTNTAPLVDSGDGGRTTEMVVVVFAGLAVGAAALVGRKRLGATS